MHELGPSLLVVLGICVAGLLARRTGVPSPVLLVLIGLGVAALPGQATLELSPEVVLAVVLPPLLYSAALDASLLDFRANARPIALLSVGLVVWTAAVVGTVAHLLIPDLPWSAALALGAIVAPPDAVAAIAIGRRVGMPARLQTLVEGEGLLNDATALVLYQVAVAVVVSGTFSAPRTVGLLLLAVVGGTAVGLAVAAVIGQVRRRLEEPLVENVLSLATPFLAYLPAEEIGGSGVLAVVVCGLVLGHATPTLLSSTSRLQTQPVWRVVVFLLEGGVFLLIGLQLPEILEGLHGYAGWQVTGWSTAIVLAVLLSRPVWIVPATYLPRRLSRRVRERDPAPSWEPVLALSWAGMRGVVSLAAAFGLATTTDDGSPFPQRDLILFLVFVVILTTLLLQGLTFGRLLRLLDLRPDRQGMLLAQAAAQQAAARAALLRLDEVVANSPEVGPVADQLRRLTEARANARWERLAEVGDDPAATPSATWRQLRGVMLDAERGELLRLRNSGRLPDEAMREMQLSLDLEEAALRR
ncbi:MAG TPA: Na+/H+ antiporter [Mycobacteriales bacterium]|nr:Na+/H+ antiporter [Mycobacteriales bacterium]